MKSILIITRCRFPDGDANSVRQYALAKLFESCDFNVLLLVIGNYNSDWCYYKNIRYMVCSTSTLIDKVKNISKTEDIFAVILNDIANFKLFICLKKYFIVNNIQIIHDAVEWYSSKQFKRGILSRTYIKKEIMNRFLIDKKISVISISRYFEKYYTRKQIKTVRIPVIFDLSDMPTLVSNKKSNYLKLVYVGSPGGSGYFKDDFKTILEGIGLLNQDFQSKIQLDIVGISQNDIILSKTINAKINFYGQLKREKAIEILKKSDFSILLRPIERYTKAGFPTKFAESMAFGIPIITNITSDLGMYIKDMKNGIVIQGTSSKAVANAIIKALNIDNKYINEMKICARRTAEKNFDYRNYSREVKKLLRE